MASTLGCIGFAVDDKQHLASLLDSLVPAPRASGGVVQVYEDPSGALLTVSRLDGDVVDLIPSYDGPAGALLGGFTEVGPYVAADVHADGETVTRLLADARRLGALDLADPAIAEGPDDAVVVALGIDVGVHADAAAFAVSDASLLGGGEDPDAPRFADESFLAHGLFAADPDEAEPLAFLAGTVLRVRTRLNQVSGQRFHTVTVRTVGFEATVCLAAEEHPEPPEPGNVVAGMVYLVLDVPAWWGRRPRKPRRGLLRLRGD